jgi:hypothetical protein
VLAVQWAAISPYQDQPNPPTHLFPSFSIPPNSTHSPRPLSTSFFYTILYLTLICNNSLSSSDLSLSFVPFSVYFHFSYLYLHLSLLFLSLCLCLSESRSRTSSRVLRLPRNLNALFQKKRERERDSNWSHCNQATSIVSGLCLLHPRLSNLHQVLVISRHLCCAVLFPMLGS